MTDPEWGFSRPRLERSDRETADRDGVPWSEEARPDVRAQLAQRRQSSLAAWRRDAFREAALLVLAVGLVAALYVVAVAAKDRQYRAAGDEDSATFWMESAMVVS